MPEDGKSTYLPLVINVTLTGRIPDELMSLLISKQVHYILDQVMVSARIYAKERYGYLENQVKINILSSPFVSGERVLNTIQNGEHCLTCVIPYDLDCLVKKEQYFTAFCEAADTVMQLDIDDAFPQMAKSSISSWMLDQSDLAFVLWDGKETSTNGDQLNTILMARERNIPCIWIDITSPADISWTRKGYFERFNDILLNNYMQEIFNLSESEVERLEALINPKSDKPRWWQSFYKFFIYKNRIIKEPVEEDPIMMQAFQEQHSGESQRKQLLRFFDIADQDAVASADMYRSMIYLRAIFPLIICIALAVGFYAENLLGWTVGELFGISKIWGWVAAISFGFHGALSLLMYYFVGYSEKRGWHRNFTSQRYIAEALRLSIHFIPFGVPISDFCLSVYGNKVKKNKEVINRLRSIIRATHVPTATFDNSVERKCIVHLENLVNNQIGYHRNTIRQYEKICKKLKGLANGLFFFGVGIIVMRAFSQVLLQFIPITGESHEVFNLTALKSTANMLALLIPTIASHFSLKLSMCNFEGLLNSSKEMLDRLFEIQKAIANEKKRENIAYEGLHRLSKEMIQLILGELSDWYAQLSAKRITR